MNSEETLVLVVLENMAKWLFKKKKEKEDTQALRCSHYSIGATVGVVKRHATVRSEDGCLYLLLSSKSDLAYRNYQKVEVSNGATLWEKKLNA